jgi:hypothetical protein
MKSKDNRLMEVSKTPAVVINRSTLKLTIIRNFLSDGVAISFILNTQFMNPPFRADQIVSRIKFASTKFHGTLSKISITQRFNVVHPALHRMFSADMKINQAKDVGKTFSPSSGKFW